MSLHQDIATSVDPTPEAGFYWAGAPWGRVVRCSALDPFADHFFSARGLEPLTSDVPLPATANQTATTCLVAEYLNAVPGNVWRVQQVHGAGVYTAAATPRVNEDDEWPMADALVTARSDLVLTVRTADCVPVLVADRVYDVVAAVHAGWRGLASRVIPATIAYLQSCYGTRAADLVTAIGPSIGPTRYEVGEDVRVAFLEAGHSQEACSRWFRRIARVERPEIIDEAAHAQEAERLAATATATGTSPSSRPTYLLDMWQASHDALVAAGVPPAQIHVARLCTATHVNLFHSYRVEGVRTGSMISAVRSNRLLKDVA